MSCEDFLIALVLPFVVPSLRPIIHPISLHGFIQIMNVAYNGAILGYVSKSLLGRSLQIRHQPGANSALIMTFNGFSSDANLSSLC